MSMMITEIYEALVEAGTSEEKAKAAAGVMPVTDNLATKADLQELRLDMSDMEMRLIKWMVSLHLATVAFVVALIKLL